MVGVDLIPCGCFIIPLGRTAGKSNSYFHLNHLQMSVFGMTGLNLWGRILVIMMLFMSCGTWNRVILLSSHVGDHWSDVIRLICRSVMVNLCHLLSSTILLSWFYLKLSISSTLDSMLATVKLEFGLIIGFCFISSSTFIRIKHRHFPSSLCFLQSNYLGFI